MHLRLLVCITLLALCHLQLGGQALTNGLPSAEQALPSPEANSAAPSSSLPEDPSREILPMAQPEAEPASGVPVHWEAQRQTRVGDDWTLSGDVIVHYRDYLLRADKVVFHQSTSEIEAEGHIEVTGGPEDVRINASNGEMHLKLHTARYFNVTGSMGIRTAGRSTVYSTTNPFLFSGRVLLQTGEGLYLIQACP